MIVDSLVRDNAALRQRIAALEAERDEWKAKQAESFAFYEDQVRQTHRLEATVEQLRAENRIFREMLFTAHTHGLGYADDGELQDSRVRPFIDWKRDSVDEIRAKLFERATKALAGSPAPQPSDTQILDWWSQHLNFEHGTDYDTGEVVIYEVIGNVNDREWHERARGETLREALSKLVTP